MRFNAKKVISLLMIVLVALGLCACGDVVDILNEVVDVIDSSTTNATSDNKVISEDVKVVGDLEVHFIDVGQADCILIKNKDDAMLIDAGNNDDAQLVEQYLKKQGITKLDYVIGTHPHEDHIGSLDVVINKFDIGIVIMPNKISTTKTFEDVLTAIENKKLSITGPNVGDKYSLGDAEFTILGPCKDYDEVNDVSVVIRLTYGEKAFLFTGDAESEPEKDILATGLTLKSDVLKFGHHGSSTSTSIEFLEAVSPEYGVIMSGVGNTYGHPHRETLDKIKKYGIEVYRTDTQGTIVLTCDGKSISWETDKSSSDEMADSKVDEKSYVLNTNSKKFHLPSCSGVEKISVQNRQDFHGSKDELISQGYSACGTCKP